MTAVTSHVDGHKTVDATGGRLLGLANLVRKDMSEWQHGKRAWTVLVATVVVFTLAAANARINEWAVGAFPPEAGDTPAKVFSLLPGDNLMMSIGTQFSVLAVIFATMSLVLVERDSGTLAWTISKPVSRTSVLVSKWLTATLALWVTAVLVPLVVTAAVVTILYGMPDLFMVGVLGITLITVPAIFVAITLTASVFVPSQAAVGAIALVIFVLPSIVGGVIPALSVYFPTSIFGWALDVSTNGRASVVTPVAWAIGMAVLFVLARRRLAAMDL